MASFDPHNYDFRPNRPEGLPNHYTPERPRTVPPVHKSFFHIPAVRIVAIILLIALVLYCVFSIVVHPIYRLQLRLLTAKYYEIKIVSVYSYFNYFFRVSGTELMTIKVYADQNAFVISSDSSDPDEYYKIVDDVLYKYNSGLKEWQKADADEQESSSFYAGLFDRSNYKYATDKLFAWRYLDSDLYFRAVFGKFRFINENSYGKTNMTFKHFDATPHTPPWEK